MAYPFESSIQLTNAACQLVFASATSYIEESSAGQIDIYANSVNVMSLTSSGMALTTGAFVDTIETTLTNDDTHLPTSGAVFDAIAASTSPWQVNTNLITTAVAGDDVRLAFGEWLYFGDSGTSYMYATAVGANPMIRIVDGATGGMSFGATYNVCHTHLRPNGNGDTDLGSSSSLWWRDIFIQEAYFGTTNEYITASASAVDVYSGGSQAWRFAGTGGTNATYRSILPSADGTLQLGDSLNRWDDVYTEKAKISGGPGGLHLLAGASADHVYMSFYADSAAQTTRSAYFGYASVGTTTLTLYNEFASGSLNLHAGNGGTATFYNGSNIFAGMQPTQHYWRISNVTEMYLNATSLYPATTDGLALGSSTRWWNRAYISSTSVPLTYKQIGATTGQIYYARFVVDGATMRYDIDTSDVGTFATYDTPINMVKNGAVSIRYDNTTRIATTSGGVSVTGTMAATAITVTSTTVVTNLNADRVDSLHATSFLRSDAGDVATGNLSFSGDNNQTAGYFRLYDDVELRFGDSNDVAVDYNATNNQLTVTTVASTTDIVFNYAGVKFTFDMSAGTGTATDWIATSDIRTKTNIRPFEVDMNNLMTLAGKAIRHDWKEGFGPYGSSSIGFIAQDLEVFFPELVTIQSAKPHLRGLSYGKMVTVAIKGIANTWEFANSINTEVIEVKSEVDHLKERIEDLEQEIKTLKND